MNSRSDARPTAAAPARLRVRRLVLLVAMSVLATAVVTAGPVEAQDGTGTEAATTSGPPSPEDAEAARALEATLALAPTDVPPSPDDVFVAVTDAQDALRDALAARFVTTQRAQEASRQALAAAVALDRARGREAAAKDKRDDARLALAAERDLLSELSVRAYVTGADLSSEEYRSIIHGDTSDPAQGRTIMFEHVLTGQEQITEKARLALVRAGNSLTKARAAVAAAREAAELRNLGAAVRAHERADAERAHVLAQFDLLQASDRLRSGRVSGTVPEGVAIIGMPRLDAEDLAGWFETSPYRPRVTTPISDYAAWFIAEGASEGIRGDIAFAQAVLETGGFANEDSVQANNFSGIGHCDSCPSGWTFPSPQLGVRAQIQLLKSYAIRKPDYVHPLVDKRLRGPAGCCSTWGDLTTRWATDPGYGPKVMFLYTSIVTYALARRAAGEGTAVPPPA
ncbi:MAG: Mannosyl-glycoprotein endo-beta-N-acetylglucosaminidase [Acidimicrobiales bacterium]|nr:Mannosyl-glycoprotein endo-beta-N-acetylglucosaminidase [Acidimicrobiales bacterium]